MNYFETDYKQKLTDYGFIIIGDVFGYHEISEITALIDATDTGKETFRKTGDLFAIRRLLIEIPQLKELIFNKQLLEIIKANFGEDYFLVKSIYFDKPQKSNWFVSYHQDLTISVDKKINIAGFGPYTLKHDQFAVQPTLPILEDNFTIRIHLDHTDEGNGALKVIPKSHTKGIYRPENINWNSETEHCCNVSSGGIMIMKPLLLHSSGRTINNQQRRVIHLEFSRLQLPADLNWSEWLEI